MTIVTEKPIMDFESWHPYPFFRHYIVSGHGRVQNINNGRMVKVCPDSRPGRFGHCQVFFSDPLKKKRKSFLVHRLVLTAFVGARPSETHCRHLDGNPMNNHLDNLAWGTAKENAADRKRHGTWNHGERNGSSKLTEPQVLEIRQKYNSGGFTMQALADKYGVCIATLYQAIRKETWKHLS